MLHLRPFAIALSRGLTLCLALAFSHAWAQQPAASGERVALPQAPLPLEDLRTFAEVFDRIKAAYVEPVDDKTMLANAIKGDRKSTRLNSSHVKTSYAVFCLKKKS